MIKVLALLARLYLGYLFLSASFHKLIDPAAFALDIAMYQFLPLWAVNGLAIVLPWVELAVGLMLIAGFCSRAAGWLTAGMMVVFLVALVYALAKGLDVSCGCFASSGTETDPISFRTVLRDLAWLGLALFVGIADRAPLGLDALRRSAPPRASRA